MDKKDVLIRTTYLKIQEIGQYLDKNQIETAKSKVFDLERMLRYVAGQIPSSKC